jgi:hypothetical protein
MTRHAAATIVFNDQNEVLLLRRGPTAPWMLPGKITDPGHAVGLEARWRSVSVPELP